MSNEGWKHFSVEEMACHHCGECHMDENFMALLDKLREEYGKPIIVNSGYRCPEYNAEISHTGKDGPHTTGKAIDISVSGHDAHRLLYFALNNGFTGVGSDQKGDHESRFIHLDTLTQEEVETRPWHWTY